MNRKIYGPGNNTCLKSILSIKIVFICIWLFLCLYSGYSRDVLCHYMPWFKRVEENGVMNYRHWEWAGNGPVHNPRKTFNGKLRDIASVYYPRIGVYDSSDPDVIVYHILSAKLAGIDGFILEWNEIDNYVDKNNKIVVKYAEKLDFKFAVLYEEKDTFPLYNKTIKSRKQAVSKAVKDFKHINDNYLRKKNYWRKNGKACVFIFNSWGENKEMGKFLLNEQEWKKVLKESGARDIYVARQNFDKENKMLKAAHAWTGDRKYVDWFLKNGEIMKKSKELDFYVGCACPGFNDFGVWGWGEKPRFTARLGLDHYKYTWDVFSKNKDGDISIATWNDFEEGTVIEPTVQFKNIYLDYTEKRAAEYKKKKANTKDNSLPYKWFILKKFAPKKYQKKLTIAKKLLATGSTKKAGNLIKNIKKQSGVKIPLYLDIKHEYPPLKKGSSVKGETKLFNKDHWNKEDVVELTTNGFKLSTRTYGFIYTKQFRPFDPKMILNVDIKNVKDGTYTIQLQCFDFKNNFLGEFDFVKRVNLTGIQSIKLSDFSEKIPQKTEKIMVKFWLEGKIGAELKFNEIYFSK